MRYTIGQAAKKIGVTAHTLRYYDKEGLLPFVKKGSSGARVFLDEDIEWLFIIECLKSTGMQLKDIKKYMDLCQGGDATIVERREMFKLQKRRVAQQMEQLKQYMEKIDFKIAYYTEALSGGESGVFKRNKVLAREKERLFGEK